jgi:hypothetical protein
VKKTKLASVSAPLPDEVARLFAEAGAVIRDPYEVDPALFTTDRDLWRGKMTARLHDLCGFRTKTLPLAVMACEILEAERPMTLRGLFYRVVSAGVLPNTDRKHYDSLGRIMTTLRERGEVPFSYLVDNVRSTLKPSSWSGLADYGDTVRRVYRKDYWASLPEYVHIFCEKDAMAGVLQSVTHEYDVALSVIRGYVSLSFAHQIALQWSEINKPITAYYLGDFDPSGFDLERDLREKLERYCDRPFAWVRLAVTDEDFNHFDLFPLKPKTKDRRTAAFLRAGYTECAELDAIPAVALRERLEQAILSHIPADEWNRLIEIEDAERDSVAKIVKRMRAA